MYRAVVALLLAWGLAGCGHTPPGGQPGGDPGAPAGKGSAGCALEGWQAQTAPVINKRQGQDALDTYDMDGAEGPRPCP